MNTMEIHLGIYNALSYPTFYLDKIVLYFSYQNTKIHFPMSS